MCGRATETETETDKQTDREVLTIVLFYTFCFAVASVLQSQEETEKK